MRFLAPVVCLVLSILWDFNSLGQADSSEYGVLDGVYIDEHAIGCDMDTTIRFHENVSLVVEDSSEGNYNFESGTQSYVEVLIKTLDCRCRDCAFVEKIIVQVDNENSMVSLSPKNTAWIVTSAWRIRPFVEHFRGTLDLSKHSLTLYHISEKYPEISFAETHFTHQALSGN